MQHIFKSCLSTSTVAWILFSPSATAELWKTWPQAGICSLWPWPGIFYTLVNFIPDSLSICCRLWKCRPDLFWQEQLLLSITMGLQLARFSSDNISWKLVHVFLNERYMLYLALFTFWNARVDRDSILSTVHWLRLMFYFWG